MIGKVNGCKPWSRNCSNQKGKWKEGHAVRSRTSRSFPHQEPAMSSVQLKGQTISVFSDEKLDALVGTRGIESGSCMFTQFDAGNSFSFSLSFFFFLVWLGSWKFCSDFYFIFLFWMVLIIVLFNFIFFVEQVFLGVFLNPQNILVTPHVACVCAWPSCLLCPGLVSFWHWKNQHINWYFI